MSRRRMNFKFFRESIFSVKLTKARLCWTGLNWWCTEFLQKWSIGNETVVVFLGSKFFKEFPDIFFWDLITYNKLIGIGILFQKLFWLRKFFENLRLMAENFQKFWDHNLFEQWKVRTILETEDFSLLLLEVFNDQIHWNN